MVISLVRLCTLGCVLSIGLLDYKNSWSVDFSILINAVKLDYVLLSNNLMWLSPCYLLQVKSDSFIEEG